MFCTGSVNELVVINCGHFVSMLHKHSEREKNCFCCSSCMCLVSRKRLNGEHVLLPETVYKLFPCVRLYGVNQASVGTRFSLLVWLIILCFQFSVNETDVSRSNTTMK